MTIREHFDGMTQYEYDVIAHRVKLAVWRYVGYDNAVDVLHDVVMLRGDYPVLIDSVLPLLISLCRSRAIDIYRMQVRRPSVPLMEDVDAPTPALPDASVYAELLSPLPAKYKTVLTLHYLYRFPFSEISVMLGVSDGACKQIRNRGVRLLAGKYGVNLD
jgi:hypothetical protein